MITNRIWCAAPGSVDAVGQKSSGMQEAQTSSWGPSAWGAGADHWAYCAGGAAISSPPPLAPTNAACRTLSSNRPHRPVLHRSHLLPINTQCGSAFAPLSALDLFVASSVFLAFPTFFLKPTRKNIVLRGFRRGPARRGPVWEDAIGAPKQLHKPGLVFLGARFVLSALLFTCTAIRPRWRQTAQEPRGQCSQNDFANTQVGGSNFELCTGALPKFTTNKGFKSNP